MAVSQNTQNGIYQNHASIKEFAKTRDEAESIANSIKSLGYKRVSIREWNNGTKQKKIIEYIVYGWL